jgi:hypothetical protein
MPPWLDERTLRVLLTLRATLGRQFSPQGEQARRAARRTKWACLQALDRGMETARFNRARSERILLPVTRHKHTHTGLVTPSLSQLLLTAMLRALAMLMSNVASTLQMPRRRRPVNATRERPACRSARPDENRDPGIA